MSSQLYNVTSITLGGNLLAKLYAVPTEFVWFEPGVDGIIESSFRVLNSGLFGASGTKDAIEILRHVYAGKPLPLECGVFRTNDLITIVKESMECEVELEPFIWLRLCEKYPSCTVINQTQKLTPASGGGSGKTVEYFTKVRGDHYVPFTTIIHIYSEYESSSSETNRRNSFAATTWDYHHECGKMVDVGIPDAFLQRNSTHVGDKFPIPFVKDLVNAGYQRAQAQDVIMLTNRDTCLSSECSDRLLHKMTLADACFSYRRDFKRISLHIPPDQIKKGQFYPGCDLFAFRPSWWTHYRDVMPDMLLGYEAWDRVMRELVTKSNPAEDVSFNDLIYHESHQNNWEQPRNRRSHPCQIYNRQLARSFLQRRLIPLEELAQ